MNYDTGKKIAVFSFIGSILVSIGGYILNIVLLMNSNEVLALNPLEETAKINAVMNTMYSIGYLLCYSAAALGFLFMFMEERDMLLLVTAGSIGVLAFLYLFGLFGVDLSAQGVLLSLEGSFLAIPVFLVLRIIYPLHTLLFAVHAGKSGNKFLSIVLILCYIWSAFGYIVITILQAYANTYGRAMAAMVSGILGFVSFIISLIIGYIKVIHIAKSC